jgi:outer membrane protein assembly factor BamD
MKDKIFIYILLALTLSSCSDYEKLLKSSDYQAKYAKAFEYYEAGEYVKAATVYEQIANVYRGTNKADTLQYYRAMSYYKQKDYVMAGSYFDELYNSFKNSAFAEESAFMVGYCYVMLSPREELDQDYTFKAINSLLLFGINFPRSSRLSEANELINQMKEKLIQKSYLSARLYYDLGQYKASIIALRNSLNDFPDTKYREELMFLILKSNYLLAYNSVPDKKAERFQATVDEYYSFIGEFPQGAFANEAKKMYEVSMAALGQEIN